ncbi:MAG: MFS transporter [Gammaproteobacteria bacterium]
MDNNKHAMNISRKPKKWFEVILYATFFLFIFIHMSIFNTIQSAIESTFHFNHIEISYLSSSLYIANFLFLFIAGPILDKFPIKKIINLMFTLACMGTFFFAISSDFFTLFISRFIIGIAGAFCFLGPLKYASLRFSSQQLGKIIGILGFMGFLGGFLSQKIFYLIMLSYGWRLSMIFIGLGGLVCLILFNLFTKNLDTISNESFSILQIIENFLIAQKNKVNYACASYAVIMNFSISLIGALWGNLYLSTHYHISLNVSSTISSLLFLGHLISALSLGFLKDYFKNTKKLMQTVSIFAAILVLILLTFHNLSVLAISIIFFLLGTTSATQVLAYAHVIENNPPRITATASSLVSIAIMGSIAIMQPITGHLLKQLELFNNLNFTQILIGLITLLIIASLLPFYINSNNTAHPRLEVET